MLTAWFKYDYSGLHSTNFYQKSKGMALHSKQPIIPKAVRSDQPREHMQFFTFLGNKLSH